MKVAIAGSFAVYEEMKKLAEELKQNGIDCVWPKHFKGWSNSNEIEKLKKHYLNGKFIPEKEDLESIGQVELWFWKQIEDSDLLIVYNKKEREGEIGINTAMDIAIAIAHQKPIILLYPPTDLGIKGLCMASDTIEIVDRSNILNYLKQ